MGEIKSDPRIPTYPVRRTYVTRQNKRAKSQQQLNQTLVEHHWNQQRQTRQKKGSFNNTRLFSARAKTRKLKRVSLFRVGNNKQRFQIQRN